MSNVPLPTNLPANAKSDLREINLLKGWPHPSLLPTKAISNASQISLTDPSIWIPGLSYGPDPGYQPLREEISKWLSEFYCYPTSQSSRLDSTTTLDLNGTQKDTLQLSADRFCISGGASQNLACALQVFTDPLVTTVWMVAPCYYLACRIFQDAGLKLKAVPEGKDGIDLEWLEKGLKAAESHTDQAVKPVKEAKSWGKFYKHVVYFVPTFSNPSGKTMSLSTRQSLICLARKYDALVVTDDVYDFLQWSTTSDTAISSSKAPVPRLVDIDRTLHPVPPADSFGNAMSNGSFSKIVGPGVRTGWAEATPKFIYGLSQCGSSRSGGAPSQLVATFITEMLKQRTLQTHIQQVLCPAYQKRYLTMLGAIREHLLPIGVVLGETSFGDEELFGGYFIWLRLPKGVEAERVVEEGKNEWNLVVSPGASFEVSGDNEDEKLQFGRDVRLCFAWVEEDELVEGITRLKGVIESLLAKKA